MLLSYDHTVDQVRLELATHARCAVHAAADQANAPARQTLNGGDPNVFRPARGHYSCLVQRNEKDPAHGFSARFAAAMASPALV